MELSPQMAILHDTHLQDILHYVDSEAVVPFHDAHLAAVVRPEDVRVDSVELGIGDYIITTLLSNVKYGDHMTVCLRYPTTTY